MPLASPPHTHTLTHTTHTPPADAITAFVGPDTIYVRRSQPNVVNDAHMAWGRDNIDGFRSQQQAQRGAVPGACFDDIANKGVAGLA